MAEPMQEENEEVEIELEPAETETAEVVTEQPEVVEEKTAEEKPVKDIDHQECFPSSPLVCALTSNTKAIGSPGGTLGYLPGQIPKGLPGEVPAELPGEPPPH